MNRRAFVLGETQALGRFLDADGSDVVGWSRSYRCGCGYKTASAHDIYDHACPDGCGNDCCVPPPDDGTPVTRAKEE